MHFASNMAVIVIQLASVHGQVPMDKYMGTCSTAQVSMDKCLCTWLDKYMGTCPTAQVSMDKCPCTCPAAQVSMYLCPRASTKMLASMDKLQDKYMSFVHMVTVRGYCPWTLYP